MKSAVSKSKKSENWLKKILCNLTGILLIVLPLAMWAALCDYHADDLSFNKVASGTTEIHNFFFPVA